MSLIAGAGPAVRHFVDRFRSQLFRPGGTRYRSLVSLLFDGQAEVDKAPDGLRARQADLFLPRYP
jgi:hypothetical protein